MTTVDKAFKRAVAAGAKVLMPVADIASRKRLSPH